MYEKIEASKRKHPNWGGKREGAAGGLKYGEETTMLSKRVPLSKKKEISQKFDEVLKTYEQKPPKQQK